MKQSELFRIIQTGENERIEFKTKVSRDIGEEICALANSIGGYLLIGVSDQGEPMGCDPKRSKERISQHLVGMIPPINVVFDVVTVDGKKVLVVEVKQSKHLCSIGGMVYIRTGTSKRPLSIQEVFQLGSENLLFEADRSGTGIKVIDKKAVSEFAAITRAKISDPMNYLKKNGVWTKKGDLTIAGLLMFGKRPQDTMPHTSVRMIFNDGSWKRFTGNLPGLVSDVEQELKARLAMVSKRKGFKRIDRFEYPLDALREGIVNAIVHRNYAIKSEVFIELVDQSVVIKNPGSFPPGATPEDPHPIPRNPVLYELMFQAGIVERQGRGIDLIRESCRGFDLVDFEYELSQNFTTLRFFKRTQGLPPVMQDILKTFEEGELTTSDIAARFKISRVTAVRKANWLLENGYVDRIGKGPSTRYRIKKKGRN